MENTLPAPHRYGRLWKSKAEFFRPFRTAASEAGQNITPLYDPGLPRTSPDEPEVDDLNACLNVLVEVFPHVQPAALRHILTNMGAESRLQLVTEQLLQSKAKRVGGSWSTPQTVVTAKSGQGASSGVGPSPSLHANDLFRSESYKQAAKCVFYLEFRNLSHSTIKGVLAEQNFSYHLARPILQALSARSWRFPLKSFWPRRSSSSDASEHPFIIWCSDNIKDGQMTPAVKRTGDAELDHELYELFVAPIVAKRSQERLRSDRAMANELNEKQAREAGALFDCECCYDSVPFEEITVCDHAGHFLCLECIRRTVNEALYGQGWSRTTNLEKSTIRCFASTSQTCAGNLDRESMYRALDKDVHVQDHWSEFQTRLTSEALLQSGLPLQRCPFCNYAEVDETPVLKVRDIFLHWTTDPINTSSTIRFLTLAFLMLGAVSFLPVTLFIMFMGLALSTTSTGSSLLKQSCSRIYKQRRGLKFKCQDPACSAVSCVQCAAVWADPHVCFDSEQTSLRTAIETSATAAIKRTCPRCMLSFVKSSGCNKLVCNCGYTMCYVCRQEITHKEGYSHFCQHFRPNGGRCSECERCDLYGDEDEDAAIKEAVETAKKAWREKGGGEGRNDEANRALVSALMCRGREDKWFERWLDAAVNIFIA